MPVLYESYNTGDDAAWAIFGSTNWRGQTFTPSTGHYITSVKLKLYRVGSPGTITVSIRAVDGDGKPTGSDLTSGTTDGDTLGTGTSGTWREITLTSYLLSVGTQYAIVVRAPNGDTNNRAAWRGDETSPTYSGGLGVSSNDAGVSWVTWSTEDFMFEDWGNPAFIPQIFYF